MATNRRVRGSVVWGALAFAVLGVAIQVGADATSERPGSILILPKVVADNTRDTVIELTNTSNSLVHAHCFYVNGAPLDPSQPPSSSNPPVWQETDFFVWLTRQQPTHWVASRGRRVDPADALGSDGAGLDPGLIPPVAAGFRGELICVQVDSSDAPTAGNALKGAATLLGPGGDVSKYNGVAFLGKNPNTDDVLRLDGTEYSTCPSILVFNHIAEGAEDPILGAGSSVSQRLTLVPCNQNLRDRLPSRVAVSVRSCDELEVCLSGSFEVDCWFDAALSDSLQIPNNPFGVFATFGPFKYSQLQPRPVCVGGQNAGQPCNPQAPDPGCGTGTCTGIVGLVGVGEATHSSNGGAGRAGYNLHAFPGASCSGDDCPRITIVSTSD